MCHGVDWFSSVLPPQGQGGACRGGAQELQQRGRWGPHCNAQRVCGEARARGGGDSIVPSGGIQLSACSCRGFCMRFQSITSAMFVVRERTSVERMWGPHWTAQCLCGEPRGGGHYDAHFDPLGSAGGSGGVSYGISSCKAVGMKCHSSHDSCRVCGDHIAVLNVCAASLGGGARSVVPCGWGSSFIIIRCSAGVQAGRSLLP